MNVRGLVIIPLVVIGATSLAVIYHERPFLRAARIFPANGHTEVTQYAQEFADALSISTHWNTGKPLDEPYIYLGEGDPTSPDRRFTLIQRELTNSYHKVTLSRGPGTSQETVLVLQEADPGSGPSHNWRWSHDSRAVFIYGAGTPAGHAYTNSLALIYLLDRQTLFSIDLTPQLSVRLSQKK